MTTSTFSVPRVQAVTCRLRVVRWPVTWMSIRAMLLAER
jgi:hypothetical protein